MPAIVPTSRPAATEEDREAEQRRLTNLETGDRLRARRVYAYCLLALVVVQLGVADATFLVYGFSNAWRVPAAAIYAWLGATIVQVTGGVLIIARSIFTCDAPGSTTSPTSQA